VTEFKKFDQGKPQLSYVPRELKAGVAKVMTFGAERYGQDNWRFCNDPRRYLDAAMRHLDAYAEGEITDPDSLMPHLYHAACNIGFLIALDERGEVE
jgi:hypothetical protein